METKNILSLWRDEGRFLIQKNFAAFRLLVRQAKNFLQCGNYQAASAYGAMAATHATFKHCGLFASPELEQVLLAIGRNAISRNPNLEKNKSCSGTVKNVLHIITTVSYLSGPPRLLRRWIQEDRERSHSVVLTQETLERVPQILREAVTKSQGHIYGLFDGIYEDYLVQAERLRELAATADVIVLHTNDYDIIPLLAFAHQEQFPPIIFVNNSDHRFWLGTKISDIVVNLRESGQSLSQQRRGIEAKRNLLLPTILNPPHRHLSRTEAKRKLGLDENSVLLLSIARWEKYRTINGMSFADSHVSLLKQHNQAALIVIGPGNKEDWSEAIAQTQGRIKVLGQTEDTSLFYQAADIYVDSFPIHSITSLLEAGSYGLPLVTRSPYSEASAIFAADAPGLDDHLICNRNLEDYLSVLSNLIENEAFRLSLGEATRRKISETHWGNGWQQFLNNVYTTAVTLPKATTHPNLIDEMVLDEPDVFLPRLHCDVLSYNFYELDEMKARYAHFLPFEQRLQIWFKLMTKGDFGRRGRFSLLLSKPLYAKII